ncbi:hypothetical protein ACFFWC_20195 [Plantactinospora siamensis]|uniref:Toprim domain-containing protein n=1 Tax=Plantactinospora siamensis TaxID=555372 RepID=A0ABV6P4F1_9ACTN
MDAYTWMTGLLDAVGSRPTGGRVRQCPAHPDRVPSLSVRPGPDGGVWLKCFAGCGTAEILAALRCSRTRLAAPPPVRPDVYVRMVGLRLTFPPAVVRRGHPAGRGFHLAAVHDYGPAVLERWRSGADRELRWETVTPSGARIPGLIGVTLADLPLYREAEVRMAVAAGEPVLLVESESSVDALAGWYATTWAGGAPAVNLDRLARVLGRYPYTVVIPDHDAAGLACLRRLAAAGLAPHVLLPAAGEDARDLYGRLGPHRFADAVHAAVRHRAAA